MKLINLCLVLFIGILPDLTYAKVTFTSKAERNKHEVKCCNYTGETAEMRRHTQDVYSLLYSIKNNKPAAPTPIKSENKSFQQQLDRRQ